MKNKQILEDLNEALIPALGCTDPVSIAYAASCARDCNPGNELRSISLKVSGGLIKNAAAVYIPNTDLVGITYAAVLGVMINDPSLEMQLLSKVDEELVEKTRQYVQANPVMIEAVDYDHLFIQVDVETDLGRSTSIIDHEYTHLAYLRFNDVVLYEDKRDSSLNINKPNYTIQEIIDFAKTIPLDQLDKVKQAIRMNRYFYQHKDEQSHEMGVGNRLHQESKGHIWLEIISQTAGSSDARMAGSGNPVMSNSGSGNQGLLTILPILLMSDSLNVDEQIQLRACALSAAIMMTIKKKFGLMSGICSAVVASCGTAAGLTFLQTQDESKIKLAIQNTIANVSGIHCDGAKTSCALKVSTCTFAALTSSSLALSDEGVSVEHGYIEENIDDTIDHLAALSRISKGETDQKIIEIITCKQRQTK